MIEYKNKSYVCLLDFAMDLVRGKWKALILCHLYNEPIRFLELQRKVKGVSQKVLNEKLKELENDELIDKVVYPEVPPKVEYHLTTKGVALTKILKEMENWSLEYYPELKSSCD